MNGWRLRRHVHVSWQIAFVCAGVVLGIILSRDTPQSMFASFAWLLTGTALGLTAAYKQTFGLIIAAILGGVIIGLWRGSVALDDTQVYKQLTGSIVSVEGAVAEDTELNQRGQLVVRLHARTVNDQAASGTVWVTVDNSANIRRSDIVTVKAKASDGFGSFVMSLYSANVVSVVRPVPGDQAIELRDWFAGGVRQSISEPESSLGLGFLVGQRRGLPEELDAALTTAGLTHIVVASGYNLTILVRLARRLFEKISKYLSLLAASSMIVGFVLITGLSPSMSRAGLVAGLSLLAWYYGRRFHPLVLLPLAMAMTALFKPSFAWGDLGWQLSFAAFAGVMVMAPLIKSYFFGDKNEFALRRIFIETIAAQVCTLPIILFSFGTLSVVAPLANVAILPLVPLAMLLTFIAGVFGLVAPMVAQIAGFPAEIVLTYMSMTAQFFGGLSWASQEIVITSTVAFGMYFVIIGSCIYMWRETQLKLEQTSLIE